MKILIVDDDRTMRKILGQILHALGHDCIFAEDGEAGLVAFIANRPTIDRVLMDNDMPGTLDGIGLIKAIRRFDKDIHICLMSGRMDFELIMVACKAGASDCVAKPMEANELLSRLNISTVSTTAEQT